jgi:hypothetical protein
MVWTYLIPLGLRVIIIARRTLDAPDMLEPQVAIFARIRRGWDVMDPKISTF